ncbi:MAG: c-type cytochrome [Ardenticatenaceae bacterium]|nr:c-type cytochrome [Ardenticatenaceae bacterium]
MRHRTTHSQQHKLFFWFITFTLVTILLWANQSLVSSLQSPNLPTSPPDTTIGLDIFAERCANCHGPLGEGNGELAANLPQPPRNYADPAWRRTAVPAELFNSITNGIIASGMPPFGPASSDPISEANRWNLVATVYSLGTTTEAINLGQELYAANCAACHGETGDEIATADLTDIPYWFNQSNESVFTTLNGSTITEHTYDLSEDDLWLITDYARTFSYFFVDPSAPVPPIPAATISGTVFNGSSNEMLTSGEALLRAFTNDFQEQLSLTAEVDANGRFQFDLTDVSPEWIYLVSVDYGDLLFTSSANQLNRAEPTLDMPVIVYDKNSDPRAIQIEQVHLIFSFGEEMVEVSELYIVRNLGTAVFVGESGEPDNGTIEFALPTGAQNIDFQRSFGNLSSFTPAMEIIPTETGWADTLPLQPGSGGLSLLVSYQLPYRDGLTIAHPLPYRTNNITAIVPEIGVDLSGENWSQQGAQTLPGGTYTSYVHTALTAGEALTLQLNGRPRLITDASGNTITVRNQTNELIIGSTALLIALAGAAYAVRTWQQNALPNNREALLQALAELDDAYEDHQITPSQYERQREQIKAKLLTLWQNNV